MDETVTDIDLDALIDGQLDLARRYEVETWLAARPVEAAAVMGDFSRRTALRLIAERETVAPSPALAALVAAAPEREPRSRMRWAIAAALLLAVCTGLSGPSPFRPSLAPPPDYLDDAVQSHEATLVRTQLKAPREVSAPLLRSVGTAIRIRLPVLPRGWKLQDIQVFPSDDGPSVQLLIDTGDRGQVSLFAVRSDSEERVAPVLTRFDGETVAFWEVAGQSFVLIGEGEDSVELRDMARDLANNQLI